MTDLLSGPAARREQEAAVASLLQGGLLPAVLDDLEGSHDRGWQTYPGHSDVGGCHRKAAYGYQHSERDEDWLPIGSIAAWVGQAVHRTFLPVMRRLLHPARIEVSTTWRPVDPDLPRRVLPPITGHVDLVRRWLVLDLKTGSRHTLDNVRRYGPKERHLLQVHANAASLNADGRRTKITHVALLYVCTETSMDRSDDEGLLWLQPVDPVYTAKAVEWWREVTQNGLDWQPRDEPGPGLSLDCDECPFLKRCWGQDAVPGETGPQSGLVDSPEEIETALAAYDEAKEAEKTARQAKEFYRAVLDGHPPGTYGAMRLSWTRGSRGGLDKAAAWDLLTEAGVDLPGQAVLAGVTLPFKPSGRPSIGVGHA